jgi:site-specific DNA-methyltransferase (adenine-specific)
VTHADCLDWLRTLPDARADSLVTDPPAGIGFMGREWDRDKGGRDAWVAWLAEILREANRALKPGAHALVWALPRTSHWTATAVEDAGFEVRDVVAHLFGSGFPKSLDVGKAIDARAGAVREVVGTKRGTTSAETGRGMPGKATGVAQVGIEVPVTAPATPEAAAWEGWGTALKPSSEHWILSRKPLIGTVAANVLAHGTGAINVDGCRIGTSSEGAGEYVQPTGRWPANTVFSHLDECAYECAPGCAVATLDGQAEGVYRFFYVAKPSTRERDAGLEHLPKRDGAELTGRAPDSAGLDNPRAGASATRANSHPTVKSIALMRYLTRLATPPGGLVLDPFTGSGTTGCAAVLEGFRFSGAEREAEYVEIARARLAHWAPAPPKPPELEPTETQPRQMSLFDL